MRLWGSGRILCTHRHMMLRSQRHTCALQFSALNVK
jgi:hypothetical protein